MINTRGGGMALSLSVACVFSAIAVGFSERVFLILLAAVVCYSIGGVEHALATRRAEEE